MQRIIFLLIMLSGTPWRHANSHEFDLINTRQQYHVPAQIYDLDQEYKWFLIIIIIIKFNNLFIKFPTEVQTRAPGVHESSLSNFITVMRSGTLFPFYANISQINHEKPINKNYQLGIEGVLSCEFAPPRLLCVLLCRQGCNYKNGDAGGLDNYQYPHGWTLAWRTFKHTLLSVKRHKMQQDPAFNGKPRPRRIHHYE